MLKNLLSFFFLIVLLSSRAQLPIAMDTISVMENGKVLKMPWANGINYANVSSIDINLDGKKDLIIFDRFNQYSLGRFRCFIKTGSSGSATYKSDPYYSYQLPQAYNWAVFFDYNKDGKEDLFCAGNSNVKVYKNVSTANSFSFTLVKAPLVSDYDTTTVGGTPALTNLYVSTAGVPGISDVDGDGDLDILTFSPLGYFVELHKNMSKERYNDYEHLEYKLSTECWGNLYENSCDVNFTSCLTHSKTASISGDPNHKSLHAGSCLTCVDGDGDGDKDLMMGDVGCNVIQYVRNAGTPQLAAFNDSTKIFPNYRNNNTTPIRLNNFPCTYVADVDGDNAGDLLASPNAFGSENYKSLWYYRNTSATGTVNFQYIKNNFLQDEMIEVGQNSYPVLFDYNADGKKDLLIGTFGYYNNNSLNPRLTLYKNTGTASQPSYSLITRDYCNLSAITQTMQINYVMPTVGDIDGDNDLDICFGTSSGQVHWLENTAGNGNVCNFSVFHNNPFTFTTTSAVAAPQLFDLDGDQKLDFIIGTKNGKLSFYKNIGTSTAPAFSLVTNYLGNVLVTDDPYIFGNDGYAVPYFYVENNTTKLLVGSVSGKIFQYSVPANVLASFNLVSSFVNGIFEGGQSTPCYDDVNNDGKRDLFVGNASGGLMFFSSTSPFVGIKENTQSNLNEMIDIFPNPADSHVTLSIKGQEFESAELQIKDIAGQMVLISPIETNTQTINLAHLPKGIYFVQIKLQANKQTRTFTKKLIKE